MGGLFSRKKADVPVSALPTYTSRPTFSTSSYRPSLSSYSNAAPAPVVKPVVKPLVVESFDPIYILSITGNSLAIFFTSSDQFKLFELSSVDGLEEYDLCLLSSALTDRKFRTPSADERQSYLERKDRQYTNAATYSKWVIPALLLGCRVRDFDQRCATVSQMKDVFVLTMPAQGRRLKKDDELELMTTSGATFCVDVYSVSMDKDEKKLIVTCYWPGEDDEPWPEEVDEGSRFEILDDVMTRQSRVSEALLQFKSSTSIENWRLLGAIYGQRGVLVLPAAPLVNPSIRESNGTPVRLNPEQAAAVARYNCHSCPAFAVEAPPGSGKTLTAAAMAVTYRGGGVQLFLSTANVPVINMALALAKLDYGRLSALHLISAEYEEKIAEENRSPFSVLTIAKRDDRLRGQIERLEHEKKHAPNGEERDKIKYAINDLCEHIMNLPHDIYFSTVDTILGRLFRPSNNRRVDVVKKRLQTKVERIVIDEASQLTEATLNALILCFPEAQIVLIGDSKQLPPFKYEEGEVVSELAARPALDVVKDKCNLPVIKLTHVYRASPSLIAHYSNAFYGGGLVSCKQETTKNLLSGFGARSGGSRCLFWKVKGRAETPKNTTSKINYGELTALESIINILRNSNLYEEDVMIISYYEAQRKRAEDSLPKGYEVLTVDSAQGRERRIVIVLTTSQWRDKGPENGNGSSFFKCPKRCNVATSRHQEALIVLGHPSIISAPNWKDVLSPKHFMHVDTGNNSRQNSQQKPQKPKQNPQQQSQQNSQQNSKQKSKQNSQQNAQQNSQQNSQKKSTRRSRRNRSVLPKPAVKG